MDRIVDFQSTLGQALRRLGLAYADLADARATLIRHKSSFNPDWFRRRQASLADLQGIIREVLAIGKSLGDAFAWFFYQNSREMLAVHFAHPSDDRLLTGRGGAGELGFIRTVRVLGNCFVLHHGITSMLRIGDISLVDLESFSVRAIGELKTIPVDAHTSEVRVSIISGDPLDLGLKPTGEVTPKDRGSLNPAAVDRLRRQLARMTKAIKDSQSPRTRVDVPLQHDTRALQFAPYLLARVAERQYLTESATH